MPVSAIGHLHDPEVIARYEQAGANDLVMSILKDGVPSHFLHTNIPKFTRDNNKSALDQKAFVTQTLFEWESRGYIKRIEESQAKVILPLTVANRWSHSKNVLNQKPETTYARCHCGSG